MSKPRRTAASQLYGKGVFTTVAIVEGEPFLWEKHWHRLTSNASALDIDLAGFSEQTVHDALFDAIANRGIADGRGRITFSDESHSRIWSNDEGKKETSLSIVAAERRPLPANFKLTISPHRINTTSPLAGIKSCNYLEHLLAYEEATNRGFYEAIRLNERGDVASGCMANVFWETNGRLYTPSLKTGCLSGTTREYVLENADCEEVEAGIEEIEKADRIFLTSGGIGVVCVAEINGRKLETSDHALDNLLPF